MYSPEEVVDQVSRRLWLNERFQLIVVVSASDESLRGLCRKIVGAAVATLTDKLNESTSDTVSIRLVDSGVDAIEHVLSPKLTLTIYDACVREQLSVEAFFNQVNANRDTMGATTVPATLLVLLPLRHCLAVSRYADIMSCATQLRVP